MAEKKVTVNITEVTFSTGKPAFIEVNIDEKPVRIPVTAEVKAYFKEQFVRQNPTPAQRKKFATVMNLLRAAYKKGKEDASPMGSLP